MRGKLNRITEIAMAGRITPADAGKTKRLMVDSFGDMDHPRGCGENLVLVSVKKPFLGSPPRMRGKRAPTAVTVAGQGITPADAGKTALAVADGVPAKDHPRGCGENRTVFKYLFTATGSPPRMRGKQINNFFNIIVLRITPADAGKTGFDQAALMTGMDHPRGCGENDILPSTFKQSLGSPPRMRGKLFISPLYHNYLRITPADAGKTSKHEVRCY